MNLSNHFTIRPLFSIDQNQLKIHYGRYEQGFFVDFAKVHQYLAWPIEPALAYTSLTILKHPLSLAICLFVVGLSYYSFVTSNTLTVLATTNDEINRSKALSIYSAIANLSGVISSVYISFLCLLATIKSLWHRLFCW